MLGNYKLLIGSVVWCLQINDHIGDALPLLHHLFKLLLFMNSILDPVLLFDALEDLELIQTIHRKVRMVHIVLTDRSAIHFVANWVFFEPLIQSGLRVVVLLVVYRFDFVAQL